MPLRYEDIEPGDIVLCYGWNAVGRSQHALKIVTRGVQAAAFPVSIPIHLASGDRTWGRSDCNHAILIGSSAFKDRTEDDDTRPGIMVDSGARFPPPELERRGNRCVVTYMKELEETDNHGRRKKARVSKDITDACTQGLPDAAIYRGGVIYAIYKRTFQEEIRRLCHSTGGGCVWSPLKGYFEEHGGSLAAFRLRDPAVRARLGAAAAVTASTWATEYLSVPPGTTHYSVRKALFSAFGTAAFGPNAKARARKYREHRRTVGGPPSDNKWGLSGNNTGKKEWFCSMFVVACYHAGSVDDDEAGTYLPLDARHTTPMMLDGFLSNSRHWTCVGRV